MKLKHISISIFLASLATIKFAPTAHAYCDDAQTQSDLNACAWQQYSSVDEELNKLYQKILMVRKTDKLFIRKFRESQRAWLKFRDLYVASIYPDPNESYGSVYSMCVSSIKEKLTQARVEQLKEFLNPTPGDSCGPPFPEESSN